MFCRRASRAFTLIEILVVVAILALLISILLPSLAAAREQSKVVVCKTRMRELYNGHVFYAQDSRNRFPHWDWWLWDGDPSKDQPQSKSYPNIYNKVGGVRPTNSSQWVTFGQIFRYVRDKEVYFCPKDPKVRMGNSIGAPGNGTAPIHSYSRLLLVHSWMSERTGGPAVVDRGSVVPASFLDPERLRAGAVVPTGKDNPPEGPYTTTPNRLGLMIEEYVGFDESDYAKTGGNGTNALADGVADFYWYTDYMTPRHGNKGHILYWDGHSTLVDAPKVNDYVPQSATASKRYAATVAYGARSN